MATVDSFTEEAYQQDDGTAEVGKELSSVCPRAGNLCMSLMARGLMTQGLRTFCYASFECTDCME